MSNVNSDDVQEELQLQTYMVMAKGRRHLKRAINRVMMRLDQSGTINRLKSMWLTGKHGVCQPAGAVKALTFGDMLPVLLLIPIAVVSSLAVLVLEVVVHKGQMVSDLLFKPARNIIVWYR